jgi:TRAP-type C4-dicarboxylate transport system permease small subunit
MDAAPKKAASSTASAMTSLEPPMFAGYFRFNAWLSRRCLQIAVAGLCVILAAVLTQIFGRYVLNSSPTWTEILALVVVLYVVCLSAAVGVRDGRHIGMESVLTFLPERIRRWIEIGVYVGMILFGFAMSWGGIILTSEVWAYLNPGLPISQGWSYVPLGFGGVLIAYSAVEQIIARLIDVKVVSSWH